MTEKASARAKIMGLLAVVGLSAVTMLWLYWHYPLSTSLATVAILAGLGLSARKAGDSEIEDTDMEPSEQSV
jgi:hypothetical protein